MEHKGFPPSRQPSLASSISAADARRKSSKKDFKDRLERVCELHNRVAENVKFPVKKGQKLIYVLEWGEINSIACLQTTKNGTKVLVPDKYKVAFEASNYIWTGEIKYAQPVGQNIMKAMYRVFPVNEDGTESPNGSDWEENMSAAFRKAVTQLHDGSRHACPHRPNGRLYLGIFYPALQSELVNVLTTDSFRISPEMEPVVRSWLKENSKGSFTGNGHAPSLLAPANQGKERAIKTPPILKQTPQTQADLGRQLLFGKMETQESFQSLTNILDIVDTPFPSVPKRDGASSRPTNEPRTPLDAFLDQDRGFGDTGQREFKTNSFFSEPVQDNQLGQSNRLNQGNSIGQETFKPTGPEGRELPVKSEMPDHNPTLSTFQPSTAPERSFSPLAQMTADGGSLLHQGAQQRQPSQIDPIGTLGDMLMKNNWDNKQGRKRSLAENGQMLLKASMTNGDIEELLSGVLTKIKESKLEDGKDVAGLGTGGESTERMLAMLGEIKRELVTRSDPKRQRVDSSEEVNVSAPQLATLSNLKKTLSASSLLDVDVDGGVMKYGNQMLYSSARSDTIDHLDLLDFNFEEHKRSIIVGCDLTHEGLFFRLAPKNTEGFSEEELKEAMTSLRIPAASSIARATIKAADVDNNGCVSLDEFLTFLKARESELKNMFASIDTDNDGYITLQDLKIARERGVLQATAKDEELEALVSWMDTLEDATFDGKIHFEEFRTGMILLPPSTTIDDLLKHFRKEGLPGPSYSKDLTPLPFSRAGSPSSTYEDIGRALDITPA